jgi:hypothetical protein
MEANMGATDIWMTVDGSKTQDECHREVMKQVRSDKKEFGDDGYTGSWAEVSDIRFTNMEFADNKAAEEYLGEKIEKYEAALVVRCRVPDMAKLERSKRYTDLVAKYNEAKLNFIRDMRNPTLKKKMTALYEKLEEKKRESAATGPFVWLIAACVPE